MAKSVWLVAILVWLLYTLWIVSFVRSGHDPRDFAYLGSKFVSKSHTSAYIKLDPMYGGYTPVGYDGQFFYYIAVDPTGARPYMDDPAYRYTRIAYPMLARLLALGSPARVPYTLILINWLAVGGMTMALAAWLRRRGHSAWFAVVLPLYPGIFDGVHYDLSEPLAYSLAALGVLLFDLESRIRYLVAALAFGLGALTRETVVLVGVAYAVMTLLDGDGPKLVERLRRNLGHAVVVGGVAAGPLLLWATYLYLTMGGVTTGARAFEPLPFEGIAFYVVHGMEPRQAEALRTIILPSTIVAAMVLYVLWKRRPFALGILYLVSYLGLIVFVSRNAYIDILSSARVSTGVVLVAVLCLPAFSAVGPTVRAWFWSAGALWVALAPELLLAPVAQYGFHTVKHLVSRL